MTRPGRLRTVVALVVVLILIVVGLSTVLFGEPAPEVWDPFFH